MANYKLLTVNFPENEKEATVSHYEKMGFEAIKAAVTRNKRIILAIDRIPALEAEIDEIVKKAEALRS